MAKDLRYKRRQEKEIYRDINYVMIAYRYFGNVALSSGKQRS